jgi:hypothetical protein
MERGRYSWYSSLPPAPPRVDPKTTFTATGVAGDGERLRPGAPGRYGTLGV